jgi:hypothetical protein
MDGDVALALCQPGTPFAASSFWNTPISKNVALNPNSAVYVNEIANQLCYATFSTTPLSSTPSCSKSDVASLDSSAWSAPLYVVPANQPLVPVADYCGSGVTDGDMSDSNWTSTGWETTTTSATHTIGNTDALSTSQFEPIPDSQYQVSYTFSGSPASGSTVVATMGNITVGAYTFSSSEDNFTITKVVTAGTYSGYPTFTPSSTFNGTISAVSILPYDAAFNSVVAGGVPIPTDAHGAAGTDEEVQIYQPSTNKYWEFWQFQKYDTSGDWSACWGGVIDNVSASDGIFPNDTGATATSLPLLGDVVRIDELLSGQIDHVMGLDLEYNLISGVPANIPGATKPYSWPATRNDGGSTNTLAIPEGQRFILNPSLDLTQYAAQHPLTPYAMAIAVAAQKYGFVVDDSSATVNIRVGDPTAYTVAGLPNPYSSGPGVGGVNDGNKGLFGGSSSVMANFPWQDLEALPFNYGEPSDT